jgi:hypothetical protein
MTSKEELDVCSKRMTDLGYDSSEHGDCHTTIVCKLMTMIAALTVRVQQLESGNHIVDVNKKVDDENG